jgi:hypothetical protein
VAPFIGAQFAGALGAVLLFRWLLPSATASESASALRSLSADTAKFREN